jgi:hypothetical protein
MPVLLTAGADFDTWLYGRADEAFALLAPFDPAMMRIVQQGADKKDTTAAIL